MAAMRPTKLVLAVVAAVVVAVVAAIVAAVFQRHVVPGEFPYGLNVHVGGTEPRVFDGRCSVSIQEWLFEVALVSRSIFLSFKSVYAFRDRFGFVNGLKQMQVLPWTKKTATTIMHKIRTLFLSWEIEKSSLIALRCAAMREVAASRATVPIS